MKIKTNIRDLKPGDLFWGERGLSMKILGNCWNALRFDNGGRYWAYGTVFKVDSKIELHFKTLKDLDHGQVFNSRGETYIKTPTACVRLTDGTVHDLVKDQIVHPVEATLAS